MKTDKVKNKLKNLTKESEERASYILLVLPALAIYFFVMAFPVISSVALSFSNYRMGRFF